MRQANWSVWRRGGRNGLGSLPGNTYVPQGESATEKRKTQNNGIENVESFMCSECYLNFQQPDDKYSKSNTPRNLQPTPGSTEMNWCDVVAPLLPWGAAPFLHQPSDHLHTPKLAGNVQDSGPFEGPVLGRAVGSLQKVLQALELTQSCCIVRCCHAILRYNVQI